MKQTSNPYFFLIVLGCLLGFFSVISMQVFLVFAAIIIFAVLFYLIYKNMVFGIYLITFLLPFMITKELPYIGSKLTILEPIVLMTLVVWIIKYAKGNLTISLKNYKLYIVLLLFYMFCLISFLAALDLERSIIELSSYIYVGLLFFLYDQIVNKKQHLQNIVKVGFISFLIVLFFAVFGMILSYFGINLDFLFQPASNKVSSILQRSGQLVSFLIIYFPMLLLYYLKETKLYKKLIYLLFLIITIIVMLATGSRTGVILLFFSTILLFFIFSSRKYTKSLLKIIFVIVTIMLIFIPILTSLVPIDRAISIFNMNLNLNEVSQPRYQQLFVWKSSVINNPLIGVGTGNSYDVTRIYVPEAQKNWQIHNTFLAVWAENGFFAFLTIFFFFLLILKKSILSLIKHFGVYYEYAVIFFVAYVSLLIYNLLRFGLRQKYFWFIMGMIVVLTNFSLKQKKANKIIK